MKSGLPSFFIAFTLGLLAINALALSEIRKSYKILMLAPFSPRSHRSLFVALATGLTERGHEVTMISGYDPPDHNPNVRYIRHNLTHLLNDGINFFSEASALGPLFDIFEKNHREAAKSFFDEPEVRELYDERSKFDLAFVDQMFAEVSYPFLDGLPFITMSTSILDPVHSAVMGNFLSPAYVSNMVQEFPRPYSFINRIKNILLTVFVPYMFWKHIDVPVQEEISKRFPHLPPIQDMKKNQSMTFINSHLSFSTPLPLLPNQVEIGGIHIRPSKHLPQELQNFMTGSTPVVYMSLGSVARSSHMPQAMSRMFLSAFEKLPYKFLWKFEQQLHEVPKNVLIWKWFPQQDVLGDPNVKLFISHGGLLGAQEAIYHSTPMMLLPLMGDQPKDAALLQNAGVGIQLSWSDITEESIIDTIQELMNNSSYREKISQMSSVFRDQKESPMERAVFWTEYAVRHKGAPHLRSPEHGLSWIEVLHLDLVLVVYAVLYFMFKLMRMLVRALSVNFFKHGKTKQD